MSLPHRMLRCALRCLALMGVVGLGLLVPPLQEARAATPMAIAACSAQLLDERQLFVARESGAALRVDAAARLSFAPASAQQLNYGLRAGGLWLRFRQAPGPACADPMFLSLGNLFSNRVEVYRRAQGADWALHWSSMRTQEEGGRPRLRQAAFPLDPEALDAIEYLVRVSGPAPLLLAPSVVTGTGMADQTGDRLLLGGLLTGGILALALHCAVLARVSGLSGLFAFSASAVALAVFYGISSGVLDRGLLWLADSAADPDELAQRATSYSVAMAALFHWFFVRGLLTEDPAPPRPALHSALLLGWASMASVLPFVGIAQVVLLSVALACLAILALAWEILGALRRQHPLARATALSFGALALAGIAYIGMYVGLLPRCPLLLHATALGVWAEAIMLSAAVGAHVRNLRGERQRLATRTRELSQLSQVDPLSGLGNRRAYDVALPAAMARCQNGGVPLCLLVADLDHFKRVNDQYGHGFGDQVIRVLADALLRNIRVSDFAFRYGGEEFVLLLPGLDLDRALEVAGRVRAAFSDAAPRAPDGSRPALSVSIGMARQLPGDTPHTLFARADAALYRAKGLGRDRVEVCRDGAGPAVA